MDFHLLFITVYESIMKRKLYWILNTYCNLIRRCHQYTQPCQNNRNVREYMSDLYTEIGLGDRWHFGNLVRFRHHPQDNPFHHHTPSSCGCKWCGRCIGIRVINMVTQFVSLNLRNPRKTKINVSEVLVLKTEEYGENTSFGGFRSIKTIPIMN